MSKKFLPPDLAGLLEAAGALALTAGEMAMQAFRQPMAVEWKQDQSPVTETDRKIEAWLRAEIARRWPGHGILGEEFGHERPGAELCWILDPIDGTRSFARGIPIFGVQIALTCEGETILGVVHLPALGETLAAATGLGCSFNGRACRVSDQADPSRALIHVHERDLARARSPLLGPWLSSVQLERNWGDCYSFVLVASGRAEAALDPRMQIWDNGPLPVLLSEAGGHFCDWEGRPGIHGGSAVAVNAALAPVILNLLQGGRGPVL